MIGDKAANEPPFSLGLPPMPATYTDRLQGLSTSVAVKAPCRVATTANITLSGLQTIDGVLVSAGDRVLVKDQTDPVENGIYDASSSDWHRALDFDGSRDVVGGTQVSVVEGALSPESYWRVTGTGAPRPGVDAIHFEVALFSVGSLIGFIAANRTILAGIVPAAAGQVAYLTEGGREGHFIWHVGNYAASVGADTLEGLYVKSSVISSAQGCWIRVWDSIHGRPEWFGAQPNTGNDCLPALHACVALCPVTLLGNADYYVSSTWKEQTPDREIRGIKGRSQSTGEGTRILVQSATADTMQYGPDAEPVGGINSYIKGVVIKGLSLGRTIAPALPSYGDGFVTGLKLRFVLSAVVEDIFATEHGTGFYYNGLVDCHLTRLHAFRSLNSTTGQNWFRGHMLDGSPLITGAAGGNASIYLYQPKAEPAGSYLSTVLGGVDDCIGYVLSDAFVDTFMWGPETVNCKKAMLIVGTGNSGLNNSNIDVSIFGPIFDANHDRGVEITSLAPNAAVYIHDMYSAVTGTAPLANIHHHDTKGKVVFVGGNIHGAGTGIGIYGSTSEGLVISKVMVNSCSRPVQMDTCTDFDIAAEINNQGVAASQAAVQLTGCSIGIVHPAIKADTTQFPSGVSLISTGNTKIEVNCTRINAAAITGGASNKLLHSGSQITSTGAFGTNCLASGIMA